MPYALELLPISWDIRRILGNEDFIPERLVLRVGDEYMVLTVSVERGVCGSKPAVHWKGEHAYICGLADDRMEELDEPV